MTHSVLGDGVGIFQVLIGISLDTIGIGAVFLDHMPTHFRCNINGKIPGHRLQHTVDTNQRGGKAITSRRFWVITFLGDQTTTHTGVTHFVDDLGILVRDNDNVVWPVFMHHHIVLSRGHPCLQRTCRKINPKCIFRCPGTPITGTDRPTVDLVGTGNDAIITGRGQYFGMLWWKWRIIFREIIVRCHRYASIKFLLRPKRSPIMPTA